jgi:hypothetical protein
MTLDLSAITDSLLDLVSSSWASAPLWAELDAAQAAAGSPLSPVPAFTPTFTGFAPDVLPKENGPQLSLYLYHVEADNAREAMFWQPQMVSSLAGPGQPVSFLPMALDLYYLMSAYSAGDYHQEQMLMSVAVRLFHSNPIVRGVTGSAPWELTLTMEHRSYDEMSRLWQATTSPLRLSVVYRAAVVFLDQDLAPQPNKDTSSINVVVGNAGGKLPVAASPAGAPQASPPGSPPPPVLFGTFRQGSYIGPSGEVVSFTQEPAAVAAGQQVWLMGANLSGANIYLESATGAISDITGWVVASASTPSRVVIEVPSATASPPGSPPAAGQYQVRVGMYEVPLSIAPRVDPATGPITSGSALVLSGAGFGPGELEIAVGTTQVPANQVTVGAGGGSVSFTYTAPGVAPGSVLPISVRVNGVEADPALWVRT